KGGPPPLRGKPPPRGLKNGLALHGPQFALTCVRRALASSGGSQAPGGRFANPIPSPGGTGLKRNGPALSCPTPGGTLPGSPQKEAPGVRSVRAAGPVPPATAPRPPAAPRRLVRAVQWPDRGVLLGRRARRRRHLVPAHEPGLRVDDPRDRRPAVRG